MPTANPEDSFASAPCTVSDTEQCPERLGAGSHIDLAEGLIRRRYTDAQTEEILGGNFRRVLSQIWTPG